MLVRWHLKQWHLKQCHLKQCHRKSRCSAAMSTPRGHFWPCMTHTHTYTHARHTCVKKKPLIQYTTGEPRSIQVLKNVMRSSSSLTYDASGFSVGNDDLRHTAGTLPSNSAWPTCGHTNGHTNGHTVWEGGGQGTMLRVEGKGVSSHVHVHWPLGSRGTTARTSNYVIRTVQEAISIDSIGLQEAVSWRRRLAAACKHDVQGCSGMNA